MERVASRNEPNIAVIAVHGVADQKPYASAREVANLLVDHPRGEPGAYTPFVESRIRLPVDPIYPRERAPATENFWGDTDVDSEPDRDADGDVDVAKFAHEFMSEILSGRERADPPQVYPSIRMEGRRIASETPATIHVHELFWADLSQVGSGVVRFFGELYQLLLHLPSLGKHSIHLAERENPTMVWRAYLTIEQLAARLLSLVIPILNLILIALTSLVLPRMAGPNAQRLLTFLIPALAVVVLCAFLLRDREVSYLIWLAAAPVAGALAGVAALWLDREGLDILPLVVWLSTAAVMLWVLRAYERRQRRAFSLGTGLFGLATLVLFYWWASVPPSTTKIAEVSLHMAATILLVMMVVWFAWIACVLITGLLSVMAPLTVPIEKGRRKRARRAGWTGQFAQVLSGALFAVVTIVLWSLPLRLLGPSLPAGEFSVYAGPVAIMDAKMVLAEAPERLITTNVTIWFTISLAALLLFLAATLWAVFPSILAEINPPTTHPHERSRALGIWLSRGLRLIVVASSVGTIAVAAIYVLGAYVLAGHSLDRFSELARIASVALGGASTLLLVMIGTKQWMAGALSALDVLLDVDNYMREHPRESAPRALIAERYTSLLRYLCEWKDPDGRGYDAIVIVAHSQGTVITADLLRFLRTEWRAGETTWEKRLEPILAGGEPRIPIYFFTMGSPLRQLYNLCFPHHYAWLDEDLPLRDGLASDATIPSRTPPDPQELGVRRWVNAYRSGDYVGRTIWLDPASENVWCQAPPVEDPGRTRRERCIGRGAHTHYWDETAGEIAEELDELLRNVVQRR